MLNRDQESMVIDDDIRVTRRAFFGVVGVTCLQVIIGLGAAWVKPETPVWWYTTLIPVILVSAGFAHFMVFGPVAPRLLRRIGYALLATLFSTYCTMFAVLNTFGS